MAKGLRNYEAPLALSIYLFCDKWLFSPVLLLLLLLG